MTQGVESEMKSENRTDKYWVIFRSEYTVTNWNCGMVNLNIEVLKGKVGSGNFGRKFIYSVIIISSCPCYSQSSL